MLKLLLREVLENIIVLFFYLFHFFRLLKWQVRKSNKFYQIVRYISKPITCMHSGILGQTKTSFSALLFDLITQNTPAPMIDIFKLSVKSLPFPLPMWFWYITEWGWRCMRKERALEFHSYLDLLSTLIYLKAGCCTREWECTIQVHRLSRASLMSTSDWRRMSNS